MNEDNFPILEPSEDEPRHYYLQCDDDGYLLTVGYQPESTGAGPYLDSLEDFDFEGERLHAYRLSGRDLIFDPERFAALEAARAGDAAAERIMELTAQLRRSDSVVLEALEELFGAATLTALLAGLVRAAGSIRETLAERTVIRSQIAELNNTLGVRQT